MPLHCLLRDENLEETRDYANSGKDMELRDNRDKTALFWAFDREKYPLVSQLLDLNANSNSKDENGKSVLHQAVIRGKYDVANQLLASGAAIAKRAYTEKMSATGCCGGDDRSGSR